MYNDAIKHLTVLKNQLGSLLEDRAIKALDLTDNDELQNEIQNGVIDYITETIENLEIILEDVDRGDYDYDDDTYDIELGTDGE
jgi:hypothetical protein